MSLEPWTEGIQIAAGAPNDFSESREPREGHVIHTISRSDVLGPQLRLSAENLLSKRRVQFGWYYLEGVGLFPSSYKGGRVNGNRLTGLITR